MEWKDITLKQAKQIFSIPNSGFTNDEYMIEVGKIVFPQTDFDKISISDIINIREEISGLLSQELNTELKYTFLIDGKQYGLHYDLTTMPWHPFAEAMQFCDINPGNIWEIAEQILSVLIRPIEDVKFQSAKKSILWNFPSKRKAKIKELEEGLLQNKYKLQEYDLLIRAQTAQKLLDMSIDELYPVFFYSLNIAQRYLNIMSTTLREEESQI